MRTPGFCYVEVGEDKLILCLTKDYDKNTIQKVISKAFPELFKGWFWFKKPIKDLQIKIGGCHKTHSSQFDCQIYAYEEDHDWEKKPFVALWVFVKKDVAYCGAKSFAL